MTSLGLSSMSTYVWGFINILLEKDPQPSSQRGLWNGSALGTRMRLVLTVLAEVSDRPLSFVFSMPKEA